MSAQVLYASTWRNGEFWDGPRRYLAIVVYDTHEEFVEGCRLNYQDMSWDDAAGGFFPNPRRERYNKKTKKWEQVSHKSFFGTIRLQKGLLTDEIVIHEVVHAAAHLYRLDVESSLDLGDDGGPKEEKLAYIMGDLGASVTKALCDGGLWP